MEGVTTDKIKWLKYVQHYDIRSYELLGWAVVAAGGEHAVLMEWMKDGDPIMPERD